MPKAGVAEMRSQRESTQAIGTLALGAGSLFVTTYYKDGETVWVNLKTGDLVYKVPSPAVWFAMWSILVPGVDGDHEMFCTISEPSVPRS